MSDVAAPAVEDEGPRVCERGGGGWFVPLIESEHDWPVSVRAVLYALAMVYLFLGMNITCDAFMDAISTITARKIRKKNTETGRTVTHLLWNDTIANLTLLALGSSAPEIMLSIVEIVARNDFYAGNFGPQTIVGSAAFNLFVIVSVCIFVIPSPEVRLIHQVGVFNVTAIFSMVMYFWMIFIVQFSSPEVIDVWEGVMTVCFFPVLLSMAYLTDTGYFDYWNYRIALLFNRGVQYEEEEFDEDAAENEGGSESGDEEQEQIDEGFELNADMVLDCDGRPFIVPAGILTFDQEQLEVPASDQEQKVTLRVHRKNGWMGEISCIYRTDSLSSVPGFGYEENEGLIAFADGEDVAEIEITILPRKVWKRSDEFQVIIQEADGGAIFNPFHDGGEEQNICTIKVLSRANSWEEPRFHKFLRKADSMTNWDQIRLGNACWYANVQGAFMDIYDTAEGGQPTRLAWIAYFICLPWKLYGALFAPPPPYLGGWLCFMTCIFHIGFLTSIILDFAELFGCVADIKDGITAITFVALGTSMPDLFASKIAAVQDEWADASIVNVTGSNSVNVILGIGVPWTLAAIYWKVQGATDEWKAAFPELVNDYPGGAFVVAGGDLPFAVLTFFVAALVCLMTIRIRRFKCGGELGGPFKKKLLSSALLLSLWSIWVLLSVWKMAYNMADLGGQMADLVTAENLYFLIGVIMNTAFVVVSVGDLIDKLSN